MNTKGISLLMGVVLAVALAPGSLWAHCDTMNGPVITTAKAALEKGDVTPVLKWVRKDDEGEIRRVRNRGRRQLNN